ncbi:MAG: cell envelope integrity protein CreD [Desulfobacterales bacterium]|nr:cell envelope integrity protein CreD [Desulfobacterales bacterium]
MEQSFFKKIGMIAILIILLTVPLQLIFHTIQERSKRNVGAYREIAASWGPAQNITGPVLTIPYYDGDGNVSYGYFLPDTLNVKADLNPEKRYRGIFKIIVYGSEISMAGSFPKPDFSRWGIENYQILWDKATMTLGINGLKGIREIHNFQWNGNPAEIRPGEKMPQGLQGVTGFISPDQGSDQDHGQAENQFRETNQFRISFMVHGSRQISFFPAADKTLVEIESSWAHPGFRGSHLPSSRTITKDGFKARWQVSSFGRDYPGMWLSGDEAYTRMLANRGFGVELIQPVNFYTTSERSVKYGLLIISLTFLCFFMFEILNRLKIHPMQYLLVGFSLSLFYLLLISFAEHIGFFPAYLLSASACIILITWYTKYVLNKRSATIITGAALSVFFSLFYIILQHEGYSLVIGSSSLFVILALVMWLTRKLDWYAIFKITAGIKRSPLQRNRQPSPKPVEGGVK